MNCLKKYLIYEVSIFTELNLKGHILYETNSNKESYWTVIKFCISVAEIV